MEIDVMRSILYRAVQSFPRVLSSYLVNDSGVDATRREGSPPALGSEPGPGYLSLLRYDAMEQKMAMDSDAVHLLLSTTLRFAACAGVPDYR